MNILQSITVISLMATASAFASANDSPAQDAVARFQQQMTSSSGISYRFTHAGSGMLANAFPPTTGRVLAVPSASGKGLFARARISATSQIGEQQQRIEVSADTELVRSIDDSNQRMLNAPKWRNGVDLVNFQYLMPLALVAELASLPPAQLRYEGEQLIDGVPCIVVGADPKMANLTLYFGTQDGLLYGGVARKPEAWGDATIQMSFSEIDLDRQFRSADFVLTTPDGYDEYAYSGDFPAIGAPAPEFRLTSFDGRSFSGEQLKGKVVVLDFWATWCGPCKQAMPGLEKLHQRYADQGLQVIGVNFGELAESEDGGLAAAKEYLTHYDYSYRFAQPSDESIAEHYKPNLPMAVVIDRQGRIAEIYSGYFGEESDLRLEALVSELL